MQKSKSILQKQKNPPQNKKKKKKKELIFPTFPSAFSQLTPVHLKEFLKGAPGKFATSWSYKRLTISTASVFTLRSAIQLLALLV